MDIEHKMTRDDEIIPRTATYRAAFFNDTAELLISLALVAVTFIIAFARQYGGGGAGFVPTAVFVFAGTAGFASLAAFAVFFRGGKLTVQTAGDRVTVYRGKRPPDVFYYSEITAVKSEERRFFGIRRGFTVTVSSGIRTAVYRVVCPGHVAFENSVFAEAEDNIKIWAKSREVNAGSPPA